MEALAKLQKECYEDIVRIKTNYKKDSEVRKTLTYVETRLDRLESQWGIFVKRDKEIEALKKENPEHAYFSKNFYREVENYYENLKDMLQEKLKSILEEKEAGTSPKGDPYPVKLLRIQEETINLLTRLLKSIEEELGTPHTSYYYQQKLNAVQIYWNKVMSNHTEIIASPDDVYNDYLSKRKYQLLEDNYHKVVEKMQEQIGSTQRTDEEVKLPRLVLPIFEGDYQNWTSFHDIFLQLIHNNSRLGDAEKMHYLKTHVKKEAGHLLQHLTVSNANYKTAWKLLNDRYNNKRKICSTQLQILLSQPKLDQESANGIRRLHDTTRECLHALGNLGITTDSWAPIIVHIIIQKLDPESHKLYEQTLEKPRDLPTIETMFQFLELRFQSLESLKDSKKREGVQPQKPGMPPLRYKACHTATSKLFKCTVCQQHHKIYECPKFVRLTIQDRKKLIQSKKLCLNCLMHKDNEKCRSRYKCGICKRQHHTLLHQSKEHQFTSPSTSEYRSKYQSQERQDASPSTSENQPKPKDDKIQSLQSSANCQVILATALIRVRTGEGRYELLRALIDPGSQASFVSEETAKLLALPRYKAKAEVSGLGLVNAGQVRHKLIIELLPRFSSNFAITIEALVLPQLTKQLPSHIVRNKSGSDDYRNIVLADPMFHTPGPINIIIGADVFSNILCNNIKRYRNGLLGQQTEFGWILSGPINGHRCENAQLTSMVSRIELDETLKRFWEIENVDSNSNEISEEDKICEQHFITTHKRNTDGTYTVRIPFNDNIMKLGESKRKALARLLQNERKFDTDRKLEADYRTFMQEYITLKHMVNSNNEEGLYLPHHAVLKQDSTTTKLRVVFDASSKTTTGISLNEAMHAGPKLQNDLTDIILRWRKYRYVLTADIEKMYRQIQIHTDDQKYLKILWRPKKCGPVQEYQLTTVTYGTAAAPFLAIRTLHQLAKDEKANYPKAADILLSDFYVDDLLTGSDSIKEARIIQTELTALLASGGFKLRKWSTNQQVLLQNLSEDHREKGSLEINNEPSIKTLGLYWLPGSDYFQFQVKGSSETTPFTKRSVLSDIARIYDPTGWLSPIVIRAKLLMQELWAANLGWDTPLPNDLSEKWGQFKEELKAIQQIKIPRWIKYGSNCQKFEYHGYCDASEKAYAAVIYTRVLTSQGDYVTTMLAAKTKVAPIKNQVSLPRLELCAAVLLTKLLKRVKNALKINTSEDYLWTDSMITLSWIRNTTKKVDKFVSNRVSEILQSTATTMWHHIRSEDNPADCASRGISPLKFRNHTLWWVGPNWLLQSNENWPKEAQSLTRTTACSKTTACSMFETNIANCSTIISNNPCDLFSKFSSLTKLIRVLTYCRRFLRREKSLGMLTTIELHNTLIQCVKIVQGETFTAEIKLLSEKRELPSTSKLKSLAPFLDADGILRIGGRLQHSHLPYNEKHPMIIPHSHHFTTLLIRDAHLKTLHGGNQLTLSYLRRKYWIINAKGLVRSTIHQCVTCCRYKGTTSQQLMGHLPAPRVLPSKPFTNTGIDYAGPFNIRVSKGRGTKAYKGYIAIFICLSTKAIHLEVVSDLTTQAFLAAYKRFVSRRGVCSNIYSDCGTTFVGAKNELHLQFLRAVQSSHKDVIPQLANYGTQWHFIPPGAPHFGGLWEAGVKSTKYHLKRIAGEINWTFEEFTTLLTQIEACLNSRPLCPLSNDPNDLTVLTPAHFLIGEPITTPPEQPQPEKVLHLSNKWMLIQKLRNDFWRV